MTTWKGVQSGQNITLSYEEFVVDIHILVTLNSGQTDTGMKMKSSIFETPDNVNEAVDDLLGW